jgi:hypothetical protein
MIRRLVLLLVAVGLALPLAGCGRKSTPQPAEGAFYPFKYPYTPFPKTQEELNAEKQPRPAADGEEFSPPEQRLPTKPFELEHPAARTEPTR